MQQISEMFTVRYLIGDSESLGDHVSEIHYTVSRTSSVGISQLLSAACAQTPSPAYGPPAHGPPRPWTCTQSTDHVPVLLSPAHSPFMSPVEHIWDVLDL